MQPGELNLGRLSGLDAVAKGVSAGELTPQEGSQRIEQILGRRPTYPWWLRVLGYAIVSAAGARFLGGGLNDVELGTAIGLIGLLALAFKRLTISSHVFELTAAFVASALVSIAAALGTGTAFAPLVRAIGDRHRRPA